MKNALISIFDYTGNASRPYRENGWEIIQIDKKHGIDFNEWNPVQWLRDFQERNNGQMPNRVGIIAMIPCTAYALSGNRHKGTGKREQVFFDSQKLVRGVKQCIDFFDTLRILKFWQIENPMSDIHKHNPWMGKVVLQFDPCDFAGYDPVPENSRYNKRTWLWGNFNIPEKKRIEPIEKNSPIWKNFGGKSEKTKEARSITPLGFAYGFYEFNH